MTRLGCIKDKFDDRDYLMRAYLPVWNKHIDFVTQMGYNCNTKGFQVYGYC